jgi:hypothetical protein
MIYLVVFIAIIVVFFAMKNGFTGNGSGNNSNSSSSNSAHSNSFSDVSWMYPPSHPNHQHHPTGTDPLHHNHLHTDHSNSFTDSSSSTWSNDSSSFSNDSSSFSPDTSSTPSSPDSF